MENSFVIEGSRCNGTIIYEPSSLLKCCLQDHIDAVFRFGEVVTKIKKGKRYNFLVEDQLNIAHYKFHIGNYYF